jgi:hypothetical protein
VIESALIETSVARIAGADVAGCANPIRTAAEHTMCAQSRRKLWQPQLIGRDFSGLTLTRGKSCALNSSVNRAFVTFVGFFTSN